jgi:hypothetical protein
MENTRFLIIFNLLLGIVLGVAILILLDGARKSFSVRLACVDVTEDVPAERLCKCKALPCEPWEKPRYECSCKTVKEATGGVCFEQEIHVKLLGFRFRFAAGSNQTSVIYSPNAKPLDKFITH